MRRDRLSLYSVARRRNYFPLYVLALAAAVVVSPNLAHATTTGGSLPWDTPLQTLETDIKGPVAYGLALLGIVASGGMLIFGGEISEFTRRIMYVVLVAAIILGAASLLTTLFTTAALVS
jgi:type IV secretory pathway VirB2 component (pilin)